MIRLVWHIDNGSAIWGLISPLLLLTVSTYHPKRTAVRVHWAIPTIAMREGHDCPISHSYINQDWHYLIGMCCANLKIHLELLSICAMWWDHYGLLISLLSLQCATWWLITDCRFNWPISPSVKLSTKKALRKIWRWRTSQGLHRRVQRRNER